MGRLSQLHISGSPVCGPVSSEKMGLPAARGAGQEKRSRTIIEFTDVALAAPDDRVFFPDKRGAANSRCR